MLKLKPTLTKLISDHTLTGLLIGLIDYCKHNPREKYDEELARKLEDVLAWYRDARSKY